MKYDLDAAGHSASFPSARCPRGTFGGSIFVVPSWKLTATESYTAELSRLMSAAPVPGGRLLWIARVRWRESLIEWLESLAVR
jgi:hypothetical protein